VSRGNPSNLAHLAERLLPLAPEATAREALHRFKAETQRLSLPVVFDGRLLGQVSRSRLVDHLARARGDVSALKAPVVELLQRGTIVLPDSTTAGDAARALVEAGERRASLGIAVTSDGRYVGMVPALRLLDALIGQTWRPQADHDIDQMAVIAHEIRTPLSGLIGTLDLLARQKLPKEASSLIDTLQATGRDMNRLLSDLVDIGRFEAGQFRFRPEDIHLPRLAAALEASWLPSASARKLALAVECVGTGPVDVRLDAGRLRQVLDNLVGNAIKFTDKGGVRVTIETFPRPEGMRLRAIVEDTGCGIDPELAARLFRPFARAGDGPASSKPGSGLGLSIVRGIAEGMDGSVSHSPAEGGGSVFTVEISVGRAEATVAAAEPARPRKSARFRLGRILVAEDHPVNRMVLNRALTAAGWSVDEVHTGRQALRRAREIAYQAVLIDLRLPEMHGLEVARHLRRTGQGRKLPLVAVTADTGPGVDTDCRAAGFDLVVHKPVNAQMLIAQLADLIMAEPSESEARKAG